MNADLRILVAMTPEFVTMTLDEAAFGRLRSYGHVRVSPSPTDHRTERARRLLADADVVLTGTGTALLDEPTLDEAARLKWVVHAAGTLRPIIGPSAFTRGIRLSSQARTNALPVAEYTLAMILLELKGVRCAEQVYRAARREVGVDGLLRDHGVYDRQVGVIGASAVGRRVLGMLSAFDVRTVVYDPYLSEEDADALGTVRTDLRSLLTTSDLVSLHAPLLPETRGMLGTRELAVLRDGAVLVNTARGGLVDQDALIRELESGRIRAVLDVSDPEPPEPSSPLWQLDNVVLTPHVAGSRGRELRRIGDRAVAEIGRISRGEPPQYEGTEQQYRINA